MNDWLPQMIILALWVFSLAVALVKHGQPEGNYDAWTQLIAIMLGFSLLYWGGFFNGLIERLQ